MNPLRITVLAWFAVLASCSRSEPSSRTSVAAAPIATHAVTPAARDAFQARCAPCHGQTGRADGPAVEKLPIKPPSFGDVTWQSTTTDETIRKAIVEGGPAVNKSKAMPASRDLVDGKPDLLDGLIELVRSFGT